MAARREWKPDVSLLLQINGEDYAEAAGRHLGDAAVLSEATPARPDGAAYLAGYVVECSLKSLIQCEKGASAVPTGGGGHGFGLLTNRVAQLCAVAGARTAKYVTQAVTQVMTRPIAGWRVAMRYRPPGMTTAAAAAYVQDAREIYDATVVEMRKDGVI